MGDRQTFQVMPSRGDRARRTRAASARALPFRHENEIAQPHYYGVALRERHQDRDRADRPRGAVPLHVPGDDVEPDLRQRQRRRGVADDRPGERRRHRLVRRPQRPLQRRHADVRLRHVRQADHGQRDAARRRPTPATSGYDALRRQDGEHADRDVADRHRPGASTTSSSRSRRTDTVRDASSDARAAAVGRQARRDRGRGRDRGPAARRCTRTSTGCSCIRTRRTRTPARRSRPAYKHAVQSSHRARPPSTPTADRRAGGRRQGLRQQRVLGHLPDDVAGVLAVHADGWPASWSTASSSSTATAAGSRAGRRRATRT